MIVCWLSDSVNCNYTKCVHNYRGEIYVAPSGVQKERIQVCISSFPGSSLVLRGSLISSIPHSLFPWMYEAKGMLASFPGLRVPSDNCDPPSSVPLCILALHVCII